jgi:hypothetical protein
VVGQIFDRYGIFSLGEAGDLLAHMIDEDGLTKAVVDEQPDVFLIIHKVQLDPAKESSCQ